MQRSLRKPAPPLFTALLAALLSAQSSAQPVRTQDAAPNSASAAIGTASAATGTATTDPATEANSAHARRLLQQMVQALGGGLWLDMPNYEWWGTIAQFYHGTPNGMNTHFWFFHQSPDRDRWEFTKHRDDVQIITAHEGWEITYRGLTPLPQDQLDDYLRRRAHSIETVIHTWLPDSQTILTYDGQQLAERHLADQVTLISASNDSVTLQLDAETHLPLRRIFRWRNPTYKDYDEDAEEYDNYRIVDGIETPYNITRYRNGEMLNERFLLGAEYDRSLPADEFDPHATARRIVR